MKTTSLNFEITQKDKVLFPNSGVTKNDLMVYYEKVSDYMIPYLKNRPLTMQRFPEGISKEGFFQKNASKYFPEWVKTEEIRKVGGWVNHVICNNKATQLYLVNQYVVTFHVSLSTIDNIEYPDKLIFDLDAPNGNFELAVEGAKVLRNLLENKLGFKAFLMTTGSKGLHVVVSLKQQEDFNEVHALAKLISNYISTQNPNLFTTAIRKEKREGRLYIDFLRNSYGQTSVAPYSVRAIENAPVATPIFWDELDDKKLNAQTWNIKNIFKRLVKIEDPWGDFEASKKSIEGVKNLLEKLN
ncbi:non-homologous end-joining DNA ligase [Lutibacter citreus]|uniref:non-homologous end-joining DNA ligase n=1 Tax=Lutibacter citreus TaxID=2138210 RepID=UPI001300A270|nr:non-homologous end-joining DNA ligase [Lutibacter citreus]